MRPRFVVLGQTGGKLRSSGAGLPAVTGVVITNPSAVNVNLTTSDTLQATAQAFSNNTAITGRSIVWSTSNASFATVNTTGLVTAVGTGTATITATCEGQTDAFDAVVTTPINAVASVTISPPSIGITDTNTAVLTATVWDGLAGTGNIITGKTVTWNSATPAHVTISADSGTDPHTATATGVANGTSNITATCETVDSPACVATQSTSSATFPNEPAGAVLLRETPFTTLLPTGWNKTASNLYTIQTDATAPYTPTSVGQMQFDGTVPPGSGPANFFVTPGQLSGGYGGATPHVRTLYYCCWLKVSSNWINGMAPSGGGVVKEWFMDQAYTCITGGNAAAATGNLQFQVSLQGLQMPTVGTGFFVTNNLNSAAAIITRNQWFKYEVKLVMNTPGVQDGEVHVWCAKDVVNDATMVKTAQVTTVGWTASPNADPTHQNNYFDDFKWNPTLGGAGWFTSGVPYPLTQTQYMWHDHVRLSGIA